MPLTRLPATLVPGHQVASGQAKYSPYPRGTIEMQIPFFQGIDFSGMHLATLNLSIAPYSFVMSKPRYVFEHIKWSPEHQPESFSLSPCQLEFQEEIYKAFVYYPHPETKIGHHQDASTLEIIAPKIPNIHYGDKAHLAICADELIVAN